MPNAPLPTYKDLLWPTLKALEAKGGSASIEELSEGVARIMRLPDAVLEIPHDEGLSSEVDYRAAWARTHLKHIGAIENSERGVWTLTEEARRLPSEEAVRQLVKNTKAERRKARRPAKPVADENEEEPIAEEVTWEEALLSLLWRLDSAAFERLCQRVLRESGLC